MTFLEKAKEIEKENGEVTSAFDIINECCPSDYGLEEIRDCKVTFPDSRCDKCWNREMPNIEPQFSNLVIENAYNKGLNDAWKLARKIWKMNLHKRAEIFGYDSFIDILMYFLPQEALAKLKAYEEAQNKVVVGDVVEMPNGIKCVVTVVREDVAGNYIADGFTYVGYAFYDFPLCDLKKTGKHIDIKSILESIGE